MAAVTGRPQRQQHTKKSKAADFRKGSETLRYKGKGAAAIPCPVGLDGQ